MQSWGGHRVLGTAATPQDTQPRVLEVADECSQGEACLAGMLLPSMGCGAGVPRWLPKGKSV